MTFYGAAYPGIGLLEIFSLLLCQPRVFQSGDNLIELRLELLKFCTKHLALHL